MVRHLFVCVFTRYEVLEVFRCCGSVLHIIFMRRIETQYRIKYRLTVKNLLRISQHCQKVSLVGVSLRLRALRSLAILTHCHKWWHSDDA